MIHVCYTLMTHNLVLPRRLKENEASVRLGTEHAKLGQEHLVSAFYTNHA